MKLFVTKDGAPSLQAETHKDAFVLGQVMAATIEAFPGDVLANEPVVVPSLRWTTEPPAKPGLYLKKGESTPPFCRMVTEDDLTTSGVPHVLWCGPLEIAEPDTGS